MRTDQSVRTIPRRTSCVRQVLEPAMSHSPTKGSLRTNGTSRAAESRREEILDAATELFAEHGFSDAVTQLLADKLGVGKGTIYRHFPSKRALFLAAADRVMRKM